MLKPNQVFRFPGVNAIGPCSHCICREPGDVNDGPHNILAIRFIDLNHVLDLHSHLKIRWICENNCHFNIVKILRTMGKDVANSPEPGAPPVVTNSVPMMADIDGDKTACTVLSTGRLQHQET